MKKITLRLLIVLAISLLTNCNKSIIFDEKVMFSDANWAFENKAITFKVPMTGSEKSFTVILELDLIGTPNVDLMNVYVTTISPNGARTDKGFVFNFNAPKEPYIKGASPNEKIYRMTVYPKKYFSETGEYTFIVDQYSNKADNYGIRALRLYIERVKEK